MGVYPNCTLLQNNVAYNNHYNRTRYNYAYEAPLYVPPPVPYYAPPTVTLSQMPYTGLDLGLFGTIAYWAFLILWAALAAYLLIIKRIQNALADRLGSMLFGAPKIA